MFPETDYARTFSQKQTVEWRCSDRSDFVRLSRLTSSARRR